MWLKQKLGVAADILHDYGWRILLFRVLPWLFHRRYFVYAGRITDTDEGPPQHAAYHLETVQGGAADRVVGIRPAFYNPKIVAQRLEQGHLCFLGWMGRTPVHVRWLFTGPVFLPYLGRTIDVRPGEAYSDESYTLRKFRQQGIAHQTIRSLGRFMAERGYHRFIALIASWNTITVRLMTSHGLKRVGECGYGLRWTSRPFYVLGSVREGEGKTIRVLEG